MLSAETKVFTILIKLKYSFFLKILGSIGKTQKGVLID